jgi:hypothetical protein
MSPSRLVANAIFVPSGDQDARPSSDPGLFERSAGRSTQAVRAIVVSFAVGLVERVRVEAHGLVIRNDLVDLALGLLFDQIVHLHLVVVPEVPPIPARVDAKGHGTASMLE